MVAPGYYPAHTPCSARDVDPATNPFLMERLSINATFNSGAMLWQGKYLLVVRVEGNDRKSFFAIAGKPGTGRGQFPFLGTTLRLPETADPRHQRDHDMRLVAQREDGWIYGICFAPNGKTRRARTTSPPSPRTNCGIARTKDLVAWERLPDLDLTRPATQRGVAPGIKKLRKYALNTRPQDGFYRG
ncbi:MAG: glycosidase, partial [Lewinellaceae bacterium]|nr:glycosidase [Lewinellaceae bacterium]